MLIVLVLPGILFPPKKTANRRTGGHAAGDTSRAADTTRTAPPPAPLTAVASPFVCPATRPSRVAAETVWVSSPRAPVGFGTAGAQLLSAELLDYKSFAPGDAERPVQLVPADGPLLAHCLVVGGDTISDRKSTRLNSSHLVISYAVFCLKKKKKITCRRRRPFYCILRTMLNRHYDAY